MNRAIYGKASSSKPKVDPPPVVGPSPRSEPYGSWASVSKVRRLKLICCEKIKAIRVDGRSQLQCEANYGLNIGCNFSKKNSIGAYHHTYCTHLLGTNKLNNFFFITIYLEGQINVF